jgi:hypothetical protein
MNSKLKKAIKMLIFKKDNISLVNSVTKILDDGQIIFQKLEDNAERTILDYYVDTQQGNIRVVIDIDKDDFVMYTLVIMPVKIPVHKRSVVGEYLNRINWKSIRGRFVLDMEDGEIRYVCSFWYDEEIPTSEDVLISNLHFSYYMLVYFMPSILEITYSNIEPKEMICKMYNEVDFKSN